MNLYITLTPFDNRSLVNSQTVCSIGSAAPELMTVTDDLLQRYQVVVLDSSVLAEMCIDQSLKAPRSIVDIFQMFKLSYGMPLQYKGLSQEQFVWLIFSNLVDPDKISRILKVAGQPIGKNVSKENIDLLCEYNLLLRDGYDRLCRDLGHKGELTRYWEVEKPFNEILCRRQCEGIKISHTIWNARRDEVDKELNVVNKELRFSYNIFDIRNESEVNSALHDLPYVYIRRSLRTNSFWNFVKTASRCDNLLKLLYSSYRLRNEKFSISLVSFDSKDTIHPQFDSNGTITSRTLVKRPPIQQLRKNSRDLIIAKEGFSLIYVDYAQFEPGILADFSGDENFRRCYSEEDLYKSLSMCLFGEDQYRDVSKTVFLCFLYGMSRSGIELFIRDIFPKIEDVGSKLNGFFNRFKRLDDYKNDLITEASANLKIASCFGNYRYVHEKSSSRLSNRVKRWVLSQKIQGSASLILKTAILKCNADPRVEFLLPMHDAALFQVPSDMVEEKRIIVKDNFEKAFNDYCPNVRAKVVFKSFTQ